VNPATLQPLIDTLEELAEEWRGKARANAAVDGPLDAYHHYRACAASLEAAIEVLREERDAP
jgi:hypothetical protein